MRVGHGWRRVFSHLATRSVLSSLGVHRLDYFLDARSLCPWSRHPAALGCSLPGIGFRLLVLRRGLPLRQISVAPTGAAADSLSGVTSQQR